jgi:hypothetical protein
MKQKKIVLLLLRPAVIVSAIIFCLSQAKSLAADNKTGISINKNKFDDEKKPGKKERSLRNQNVVKVYPDALRKTMHVVAKSSNEKEIDFLVFDLNGNMVLNYKMKAGEKRTIANLKKGEYMYHVFSNDEYLTTGKIEFR